MTPADLLVASMATEPFDPHTCTCVQPLLGLMGPGISCAARFNIHVFMFLKHYELSHCSAKVAKRREEKSCELVGKDGFVRNRLHIADDGTLSVHVPCIFFNFSRWEWKNINLQTV